MKKIERIETLSADKGYDSEEIITYLQSHEIKPITDIRSHWVNKETKQYKNTDLIYTYDGKVSAVNDNGDEVSRVW